MSTFKMPDLDDLETTKSTHTEEPNEAPKASVPMPDLNDFAKHEDIIVESKAGPLPAAENFKEEPLNEIEIEGYELETGAIEQLEVNDVLDTEIYNDGEFEVLHIINEEELQKIEDAPSGELNEEKLAEVLDNIKSKFSKLPIKKAAIILSALVVLAILTGMLLSFLTSRNVLSSYVGKEISSENVTITISDAHVEDGNIMLTVENSGDMTADFFLNIKVKDDMFSKKKVCESPVSVIELDSSDTVTILCDLDTEDPMVNFLIVENR